MSKDDICRRKTGGVAVVDRKKIQGRSSCHISWDYTASHLVVVSYWDSKLTTFPVDEAGMVGEAVEVWSQPGAEYVDTHRRDIQAWWRKNGYNGFSPCTEATLKRAFPCMEATYSYIMP